MPEAKHRFIVIAHRGDHVEVPENTLAAYENAIKNGVDYVKIDLRNTKDSMLVIMHDATKMSVLQLASHYFYLLIG